MTKKQLVLFAATSFAAGTLTLQAFAQQQDASRPQDSSSSSPQQQQSSQTQDLSSSTPAHQQQPQAGAAAGTSRMGEQSPHADDVRKVLASITEAAVKGDIDELAGYFTDASSDQFKEDRSSGQAQQAGDQQGQAGKDQLKQTAQQFRDAWKAKYSRDFDIGDEQQAMVYSSQHVSILKGDLSNQALMAGARLGGSSSGTPGSADQQQQQQDRQHQQQPSGTSSDRLGASGSADGSGVSGSARVGDTTVGGSAGTGGVAAGTASSDTADRSTGASQDRDKQGGLLDRLASGRTDSSGAAGNAEVENRMATVMIQQSHGMPPVALTLVNEGTFGNKWRVQPGPGVNRQTLTQNLNQALQRCVQMKDQWPQDENQAYQQVSHAVLAAMSNARQTSGGASGAGQSSSAGQSTDAAQPAGATSGTDTSSQSQQQQPDSSQSGQSSSPAGQSSQQQRQQ